MYLVFQVIYCLRNPKDIACSFFDFKQKIAAAVPFATFNDFVNYFISGKSMYVYNIFEHTSSVTLHQGVNNSLITHCSFPCPVEISWKPFL